MGRHMARREATLSRRRMIQAGLAGGAAALIGAALGRPVTAGSLLAPTPTQSLGPFYPDSLPVEYDNDLARVAELPHAEIARRLGRSEGAVRNVLYRALSRLSFLLERGGGGDGGGSRPPSPRP